MSAPDVPGQTPDDLAARDARISELAVGFALGEIEDAELRELYDALREPGERGLAAARLTWQQLGVVTDLRAGMGGMFQDTVKHRIAREGLSDRFMRESRRRVGAHRSALSELSPPAGARRLRWRPLAMIVIPVLVVALAAAFYLHEQSLVLCRVTAVTGEATLGGEPLVSGMAIDHRQVVVPEGSQVGLSWARRAEVTIAGPANVVAQGVGLSMANGTLWTRADDTFVIGLPDDTAHLAPGVQVAIEVHDGHSTFGVRSGPLGLTRRTLGSGDAAATGPAFPWVAYELPTLPAATAASPAWSLEANAAWKDSAQEVAIAVTSPENQSGWHLGWRPGSLLVQALPAGNDIRSIPIPGAPLGETVLQVNADHGRLRVSCAGTVLMDESIPLASSISIPSDARASLTQLHFHSGPQQQPPFSQR